MKIKIKPLLLGIVLLNFIFADYFTTVNVGNFSVNAIVSALSVVLLSLACFLCFPQVITKLPISIIYFTTWMFISLIFGLLNSRTLLTQINYQFSIGLQQFLVWCLFVDAFCVGLLIGNDKWVYERFELVVQYVGLFWMLLIFLPGSAFNTRSLAALLALFFSVFYATFRKKRALKWLILALFTFAAIVITRSRTALLSCVVALIFIEFSDFRFLKLLSWRKVIPFLIIISILIVSIFMYPPMFERLSDIISSIQALVIKNAVLEEGNLATVTQGRSRVWPLLFNKALERPILGHGVGASSAYSFYFSKNSRFTHPHNEYLRILFDTGLLGLSLLLIGFLSIGKKLFQSTKKGKYKSEQSSLLGLGALVVVATLFVTDNVGLYSFFMAPLGFILGLAITNFSEKEEINGDILKTDQNG